MSMTVDFKARANQAYDPNTFFEEQRYFDDLPPHLDDIAIRERNSVNITELLSWGEFQEHTYEAMVKIDDQTLAYSSWVFNEDDEILDEIKLIKNAKIYGGNIHQFKSDHPFNKDKSFLNWQKKHNIGAVIIRPDRHVYGCCEDNKILDKINMLTNQLHKELYLN